MSKTQLGLVQWCYDHLGTNYVYGTKMEILTQAKYDYLKKTYGSLVWNSDSKKINTLCCDCSGLISSYTGVVRNSTGYKTASPVVNSIKNLDGIEPGDLLWLQGHIGVYVGLENGVHYYIAEDGSDRGCVKLSLNKQKWTHWFKCVDVDYVKKEVYTVDTTKILIDGKEYTVDRIFYEDKNYIQLRAFEQAGYKVEYDAAKNLPSIKKP